MRDLGSRGVGYLNNSDGVPLLSSGIDSGDPASECKVIVRAKVVHLRFPIPYYPTAVLYVRAFEG